MKEVKFRAWEKKLKEIIPVHQIDFEKRMINTESAWRFLDEVELMQFTGLKDKNGREIFDGDVVKGYWWRKGESHRHIGKVSYGMAAFKVVGVKQYLGLTDELNPVYEVIGNIYETPELLEESK